MMNQRINLAIQCAGICALYVAIKTMPQSNIKLPLQLLFVFAFSLLIGRVV